MEGTTLITGANRGIGLEMVRQYAAERWKVHACCRRPEDAEELRKVSGEVIVHRLDVAREEQIQEVADHLEGESIDILINNAGIFGPSPQDFGPIDTQGWLEAFRVNVIAPFQLAQGFLDQVGRSRNKVIATVGSLMGSLTDNRSGGHYVYRSSKAAVHMVVRSLAADLREQKITAVVLHPGWVHTEMGGKEAPLSPAESVQGLRRVLHSLRIEDSGRFFNYDGRELPW